MKYLYRDSITRQVRDFIRAEIEEGEFAPGTRIPSEMELAHLFGVEQKIVKSAVDVLVKEGFLKKISEKEVYVLGKKIERNLDVLEGFTKTMLEKNLEPSFKILSKVKRTAGNKYASLFGIQPQDEIFYIKRICCANKEPMSLEEIFIPLYLIPKMGGIDLSVFSIYEIYGMYGIKLSRAEQTLDLIRPNPADARILGIESDTPVMFFQTVTYDCEDRVIEFNRNYIRSDKCSYRVHFLNRGKKDGIVYR